MLKVTSRLAAILAICAGVGISNVSAQDDLRIKIPLPSKLSVVQRLNQDGVEAVRKGQFEKAETLFDKAYLYDPSDPFSLNNLGYIAELQGQLDRAQKYYDLAEKQGCSAQIDRSNVKSLQGQPMNSAYGSLQDATMRENRINVSAMLLLSEGRAFEASALLRTALTTDPGNPFTLNNLGVADEAIGDYENALKDYDAAAESHSPDRVVLALDASWRGKSVSEMAAASASRLHQKIQNAGIQRDRAAMYSMRGVSAANENDWTAAKQDFLKAYSLDPSSAFTLNNRGYVAESEGDLESAQFFYEKARKASDSESRVGLATSRSAEGQSLFTVAGDSNRKVDGALNVYSNERHQQTEPVELTPRGGTPSTGSAPTPKEKSAQDAPALAPQQSTPQLNH